MDSTASFGINVPELALSASTDSMTTICPPLVSTGISTTPKLPDLLARSITSSLSGACSIATGPGARLASEATGENHPARKAKGEGVVAAAGSGSDSGGTGAGGGGSAVGAPAAISMSLDADDDSVIEA